MKNKEVIVFNGLNYTRYPNCKTIVWRLYFGNSSTKAKERLLHRAIWRHHHGEIPKKHVIHHIDGDCLNNDIENLGCVTQSEHMKIHKAEIFSNPETAKKELLKMDNMRKLSALWPKTEEGKKFHVRIREKDISRDCKECGNNFLVSIVHASKQKYCSRKCYSADTYRNEQSATKRKCEICSNVFRTRKYHPSKTCSKKCWGTHIIISRLLTNHLIVDEPILYGY